MIAPTGTALAFDLARAVATPRLWGVTLHVGYAARPLPRRLATGLDALLGDGGVIADLAPARAAARAFAAGNGFLPGQIIDRAI